MDNETKAQRKAAALIRDQLAGNTEMVVFNLNALSDEDLGALNRALADLQKTAFDAISYRRAGRKLVLQNGCITGEVKS